MLSLVIGLRCVRFKISIGVLTITILDIINRAVFEKGRRGEWIKSQSSGETY
jgi:hypothetical protein